MLNDEVTRFLHLYFLITKQVLMIEIKGHESEFMSRIYVQKEMTAVGLEIGNLKFCYITENFLVSRLLNPF